MAVGRPGPSGLSAARTAGSTGNASVTLRCQARVESTARGRMLRSETAPEGRAEVG